MADRIPYRKLPGRRRGFLKGSSVWLGPDHLLLVKSVRFREEYKRYQLQDIQAIAIARRPRFHISTRAFGIAYVWLMAFAILFPKPGARALLWAAAAALIVAWLYVSAKSSCICRIYTAVSRDELPSVYRTWVASRFLRAVEPEIAAVQGVLDGAWTDAIGNQDVGPRETLPPESAEAAAGQRPASSAAASAPGTFYFLLAALFFDGLWHGFSVYHPVGWATRFSYFPALVVISAAIIVLVQHNRRKVRPAEKGLAIAALVAMGLAYYVRLLLVGALAGARAAIEKGAVSVDYTAGPIAGEVEMGIALLLGLVGVVILVAGRSAQHGQRSIDS